MPMYNLLEYISNYSDTKDSLWSCFKDESSNVNADIADNNAFKYFK